METEIIVCYSFAAVVIIWKHFRVGVNLFICFIFQAKPERTAEESDRLRKLMLEWQFQKRLQESKQSDEDEEEEDDEDMDTMIMMQRLEAEKRARVRRVVVAVEGGEWIMRVDE